MRCGNGEPGDAAGTKEDGTEVTGRENATEEDRNAQRAAIEHLLACQGVGPLPAAAIAINLASEVERVQDTLDALIKEGRVVRMSDGRFTLAKERSSPAA